MAINSAQWMAALADDTLLTAVAIPGSHEACSYEIEGVAEQIEKSKWRPLLSTAKSLAPDKSLSAAEYVAQIIGLTQSLTLKQQLEAGVRFFDLNPYFSGGKNPPIYNGIVRTKFTLDDALKVLTSFLQSNTSEYLVLRLRAASDSYTHAKRAQALQECLTPYKDSLFQRPETGPVAVGAARGKILLITQDIAPLDAPFHAQDWDDIIVQELPEINAEENFISTIAEGVCTVATKPIRALISYFGSTTENWCEGVGKKVPKIFVPDKVFDEKRLAIKNHHLKSIARSGDSLSQFSINFISCVGSGSDILFLSPQVCSGKFNPGIKDLIANNGNGEKTGIVVMDFITAGLARSIYSANKLAG